MANQLVDSLLSYRMQSPLVDKLLGELGIDPSSQGLTRVLDQTLETKPSKPESSDKA